MQPLKVGKRRLSPNKKKYRKAARKGPKLIDKIQVPLSNKFNVLSENEENDDTAGASHTPKQKISPIIVTDVDKDIQTIINRLSVSVETKIVSIGKKIFTKSTDDKNKIMHAFNNNKINYFSHPDGVKKVFKAVLSGLPEMNTNTIADSVKETYNLDISKIVMFNTKSHNKLYLCHFDKQAVNMKVLNTIKAVFHHIVTWQPFKPKDTAPTQCYRCAMYGHGASSCMRYAVCMLCSGQHLTKECTQIKADANEPIYKCFNCVSNKLPHNHKANDPTCPFRAKYIATRESARNKNNQKPSTHTQNVNNKTDNQNNRYVRAPQPTPPPTTSRTYAEAVSQGNTRTANKQQDTNWNVTSQQNESNIWSLAEVTQLLLNSINELQQCKSKLDQLKVIANLLKNACE